MDKAQRAPSTHSEVLDTWSWRLETCSQLGKYQGKTKSPAKRKRNRDEKVNQR